MVTSAQRYKEDEGVGLQGKTVRQEEWPCKGTGAGAAGGVQRTARRPVRSDWGEQKREGEREERWKVMGLQTT